MYNHVRNTTCFQSIGDFGAPASPSILLYFLGALRILFLFLPEFEWLVERTSAQTEK